jgi:hypothetical protein
LPWCAGSCRHGEAPNVDFHARRRSLFGLLQQGSGNGFVMEGFAAVLAQP